jgi:Zn-dependent peptidase ImmA (M78 family)
MLYGDEMVRSMEKIEVNPQTFNWLLKTSGYTPEEISNKAKISINTLEAVKEGLGTLTWKQIRDLARVLKRPTSTFFLPNPPKELPYPPDFRKVFIDVKEGKFSPETMLSIRRVRRLQTNVKELMESLDLSTEPKIEKTSDRDHPLDIARKERQRSGITIEEQNHWRDSYDAFNGWRAYIESKNILVFQMPMPVEEARGFSLVDETPYVIVVSGKDSMEARIFTLFHEYAHILLGEHGICSPEEIEVSKGDHKKLKIERWCNSFSSEFLLPLEHVKGNKPLFTNIDEIDKLARKYKVSKSFILTQIRKAGLITDNVYRFLFERLKQKGLKEEKEGWITPDKKCLKERGDKYVSSVFEALHRDLISYDTALDYLGIKLNHLEKVEKLVIR